MISIALMDRIKGYKTCEVRGKKKTRKNRVIFYELKWVSKLFNLLISIYFHIDNLFVYGGW